VVGAGRRRQSLSILGRVAVNKRVLVGSLAAAVLISISGGYALSQSGDEASPTPVDDDVTITSNEVFVEPGLPTNDVVEGEPLPTVTLSDAAGNDVSTSQLTGQPLVINVWSTTCEPCRRELPAFAAVHQEFGDQVRFVAVNSGDSADEARAFAEEYGVNYESLSDRNGEFLANLGITGLPYTLFIASDGTIVAQKGIELSADNIRITITNELLAP